MKIIPLADILIAGAHAVAGVPSEVASDVGLALIAMRRAVAMASDERKSQPEISDAGVMNKTETAQVAKVKK